MPLVSGNFSIFCFSKGQICARKEFNGFLVVLSGSRGRCEKAPAAVGCSVWPGGVEEPATANVGTKSGCAIAGVWVCAQQRGSGRLAWCSIISSCWPVPNSPLDGRVVSRKCTIQDQMGCFMGLDCGVKMEGCEGRMRKDLDQDSRSERRQGWRKPCGATRRRAA